ncbi:DUF6207 family protein [Streptomyces sp. NRRL S-31]|uniref:DUF6207 family protein n=1 Tax=Streptomyces sp. NRRL S-31 TaxID=1463898 RepID=UPI0020A6CAFE|nr:DUF6207 family protein [Streptomyces sp. NRRL S-31]
MAPAQHTTRDPGEPGVRLCCYLDLRRPGRSGGAGRGVGGPTGGLINAAGLHNLARWDMTTFRLLNSPCRVRNVTVVWRRS